MQDPARLLVWQKARHLTVIISKLPRFKPGLAPGLRGQLLEATMGIGATIAEGAGRHTGADFARFLSMAIASANEVEQHLTVGNDLGVITDVDCREIRDRTIEVRRMLFGLRKRVLSAEAARMAAPNEEANAD